MSIITGITWFKCRQFADEKAKIQVGHESVLKAGQNLN
jgi:hypothetical protein